jgi:ribosomal protein S18
VTRESTGTTSSTSGASRDRGPRFRGARPGRPRYIPKRKVCFFCANKNEVIDYKNPDKLRGYLSERAKIDPRRRTGTCARHQRELATAIKRARHLALLPFVPEHVFPVPQVMAPPIAATPAPAPPPPPTAPPQSDR